MIGFLNKFGLYMAVAIQAVKLPIILCTWVCLTWMAWVAAFGGYLFDWSNFSWFYAAGGYFWFAVILLAIDFFAKWIIDFVFGILTLPFVFLSELKGRESQSTNTPVVEAKPVFTTAFTYADDIFEYQIEPEILNQEAASTCPNCLEVSMVIEVPWKCSNCGTFVASV